MNYKLVIAGIYTAFAVAELALGRFLHREETTRKDLILDVANTVTFPVLVVPTVLTLGAMATEAASPGSAGALADLPWWAMVGVLLLADDLTQYWWHRTSHEVPWLFALHRAHHSARYLSIRVTYRNNLLYYAFMPGLWASSVLIYLGFGPVYAFYAVVKLFIIVSAHSSVPWDAALLRYRALHPILWVLERVVSTPTTHAAHHGRHAEDPGTHYKGNYGNLLFLWDVIFGTARITRRRPASFGLENIAESTWVEELVWPFRAMARAARAPSASPSTPLQDAAGAGVAAEDA